MQLLAVLDHATAGLWRSAVIVGLAAVVSLGHARHAGQAGRRATLLWLSTAALALSVGVWSAVLLELQRVVPSSHLAPTGVTVGWCVCFALSALALALATLPSATPGRASWAAWIAACAVVASQAVVVRALPLASGADIRWTLLLAAFSVAAITAWLLAAARTRLRRARIQHVAFTVAGSIGFALAASVSLRLTVQAFNVPAAVAPGPHDGTPLAALSLLASIGSVALLLSMQASALLGNRMRDALRSTRAALQQQAASDSVTGLPHRSVFETHLARAIARADPKRGRVALLYIGLDGFKAINQTHGHAGGDRVLREMSTRIRGARTADVTARLGGDEFLVMLDNDPSLEDAIAAAAQLTETIAKPCEVAGRHITLSCSIGVALYPQHGNAENILHHAGAAMRSVKGSGGNAHAIFDPRMINDSREQGELLADLRQALKNKELELYYQPKINAPSGEITGVEALMRWNHPRRGLVSPTVFVPLAERFGLINSLGDWVIDEACRQARDWRDQGLRMRVAVNLSAHQLRNESLVKHVTDCLAKYRISASLLTCEITESVAMDDAELTMAVFGKLAKLGVHISIDDFGTGYSSLSYLRRLPAEELKIDRSFVLDIDSSKDARAVVDAVTRLAHALGLKVVAEGVETQRQYDILKQLGCDELQGFFFAKPMRANAMSLWAMGGQGPKTMNFRASLFGETVPADAL